jgi:hypothetical protein
VGDNIGGSGFLVATQMLGRGWLLEGTCPRSDQYHLYAVSNRHLIRPREQSTRPSPVVRLNKLDGNVKVIDAKVDDWICSMEHDLAVLPVEYDTSCRQLFVDADLFLTKEIIRRHDVGIGDDVFMVGRLVHHDGKQSNLPSVRFGRISMMPLKPVRHASNDSEEQERFVVEVHSISGYSGSPVFVRPSPAPKLELAAAVDNGNTAVPTVLTWRDDRTRPGGPWLLGVDWGYVENHDQIHNTGMAGVVPAWRIRELLDSPGLVRRRREEQERLLVSCRQEEAKR